MPHTGAACHTACARGGSRRRRALLALLAATSLAASLPAASCLSVEGWLARQNCFNRSPCDCTELKRTSGGKLTGTVPASVSGCTLLETLALPSQKVEGTLPALPASLLSLDVSGNTIEGPLPTLPPSLEVLDVSSNGLGGNITAFLSPLPRTLKEIHAGSNDIDGELPPLLASFTALTKLSLEDNKLDGPGWLEELCPLNATLREVDLHENEKLCGRIPACVASLPVFDADSTHAFLTLDQLSHDRAANADKTYRGYCDDKKQTCKEKDGCFVRAPPILTNDTWFNFESTMFDDPESGIRDLKWGLEAYDRELDDWTLVAQGLRIFWPELKESDYEEWSNYTQDASEGGRLVFRGNLRFPGLGLNNGELYRVAVKSRNMAGPPQTLQVKSNEFVVDSNPPEVAGSVRRLCPPPAAAAADATNATRNATSAEEQEPAEATAEDPEERSSVEPGEDLAWCWDPFQDAVSGVASYEVCVYLRGGFGDARVLCAECDSGDDFCVGTAPSPYLGFWNMSFTGRRLVVTQMEMEAGSVLYVGVRASDSGGLRSDVLLSPDIEVVAPNSELIITPGVAAVIAALGMFLMMAVVFATYRAITQRQRREEARGRLKKQEREAAAEAVSTIFNEMRLACDSFKEKADAEKEAEAEKPEPHTASPAMLEDRLDALSGPGSDTGHLTREPTTYTAMARKVQEEEHEVFRIDEVCFVMTDLMDSTAMAQADRAAFREVQEAHDNVVRTMVQRHGGYEIGTQGDAFELAFASVDQAVAFSLGLQDRLLNTSWSDAVLALPSCGHGRAGREHGFALMFAGPRVRVGIHAAREGRRGFERHLHDFTRTMVFSGPAYELAQKIGDTAHGGQVVLTRAALDKLDFAAAGFPAMMGTGVYRFEGSSGEGADDDFELFQASPGLGSRTPWRLFPPDMRGLKRVREGCGFNVHARWWQGHRRPAAVCALRVANGRKLDLQSHGLLEVLVCAAAQPYRGYVMQGVDEGGEEGGALVAFATISDCVRYACVLQVAALHAPWEARGLRMGRTVLGATGVPIFHGPRIAAAIHVLREGDTWRLCSASAANVAFTVKRADEREEAAPGEGGRGPSGLKRVATANLRFLSGGLPTGALLETHPAGRLRGVTGGPVGLALALCASAHGGQTVVSQGAWDVLQAQRIRGAVLSILDLGTHTFATALAPFADKQPGGPAPMVEEVEPQLVMELAPLSLSQRQFPPLASATQHSPGYREAPDPERGEIAIVFCRCVLEEELVCEAPEAPGGKPLTLPRVLSRSEDAAAAWSALCWSQLPPYDGYCCKEVSGGKFTLAFPSRAAALSFMAETQERARVDLSGVSVAMGCAHGTECFKKVLNSSGRADFFGPLANLAARIMGQAHPGQALVRASPGDFGTWPRCGADPGAVEGEDAGLNGEPLELAYVGRAALKGIAESVPLVQVATPALAGAHREAPFPPPKAFVVEPPEPVPATARRRGGPGSRSKSKPKKSGSLLQRSITGVQHSLSSLRGALKVNRVSSADKEGWGSAKSSARSGDSGGSVFRTLEEGLGPA